MKKKNVMLIILIVVLSLCIVGLSVFVIYNKVKEKNDDIVNNEDNDSNNNIVNEEMNVEQKILYIVKDENNIEKNV